MATYKISKFLSSNCSCVVTLGAFNVPCISVRCVHPFLKLANMYNMSA